MPTINAADLNHRYHKKNDSLSPTHAQSTRSGMKLKYRSPPFMPTSPKQDLKKIKSIHTVTLPKHNKNLPSSFLQDPVQNSSVEIGALVSEMIEIHKRSAHIERSIRPQASITSIKLPILDEIKLPTKPESTFTKTQPNSPLTKNNEG